jgi:hypothetical protein
MRDVSRHAQEARSMVVRSTRVGGLLALVLFVMGRARVASGVSLSMSAQVLIAGGTATSLLATLYRWYPLLNTRPSNVPQWNDIYHRPGPRLLRAIGSSGAVAAVVATLLYVCVLAMLPKGGDATAPPAVRSVAYFRGFDGGGGGDRCFRYARISDAGGDHSYCFCSSGPWEICLREVAAPVAQGQQVDILMRTNWAGTAIVGLRPHVG